MGPVGTEICAARVSAAEEAKIPMNFTEKQAAALNALQENLLTDVYMPVFKQACADAGAPLESNEDLVAALETTAMLKHAEAMQVEQPTEALGMLRDKLKQGMFGGSERQHMAIDGVRAALEALKSAE